MPDHGPAPQRLVELANGWWAFKTLATALDLKLFKFLAGSGGVTVGEYAEAEQIERRPAEMLLTACASLGLLEKAGERYLNSPLAEEYLVPGKSYYFGHWIQLCDRRLEGWVKLEEGLRTNQSTTWRRDTGESIFSVDGPEMLRLFWQGMHSLSAYSAHEVARLVDFSHVRRLLDLGGCSGTYSVELCRQYPDLHVTVFDLPFIIGTAAERIASAGMTDRVTTIAGDFFDDAGLPAGYDAILLSMILHDWDEESNRMLLRKCFDALPSGGNLYICESVVNDARTGPPEAALMSLNMLVETEGRNYSVSEYQSWLTDAGFVDVDEISLESTAVNSVITAKRP